MTSVLDMARCCRAVYRDNPLVAGWHRERVYNPPGTGFYAALFTHHYKDGSGRLEAILAIRGTVWFSGFDGATNMMLALGVTPLQYRQARSALIDALQWLDIHPEHFYLTGHSQGGGLAALAAARHRVPVQVVTFNAPGVCRAAVNSILGVSVLWNQCSHYRLEKYYAAFDRSLHIRCQHDIVSAVVGPQISGCTRTLLNRYCIRLGWHHWCMPPWGLYRFLRRAACAHSMATVLELVAQQPVFRRPVRWV
ncbi:MAG: Mbeg1-like protein [Oleiphilaceae bacterium]|nr:Mbeg1-like protein [Oleiphilaceae bacterium]